MGRRHHRRQPLPLWRRLRWELLVNFVLVLIGAAMVIKAFLLLLGRARVSSLVVSASVIPGPTIPFAMPDSTMNVFVLSFVTLGTTSLSAANPAPPAFILDAMRGSVQACVNTVNAEMAGA